MTHTTLDATEVGLVSATAIREIAQRAIAGEPIATYAHTKLPGWSTIEDGGWDWVGVPEAHDGGGASLRDLVELARAWGETCFPLPLLETVWAKRWSVAARDSGGPVTVAVRRPGGSADEGFTPFGDTEVPVARAIGTESDILTRPDSSVADDFAPTLRLALVPWVTTIDEVAARELAVLWAAESVGAAQRLVELSVAYAKEREQFGRPIGSFQAIKHRLADMHSMAEYADTAVVWSSHEPHNAVRPTLYALDTAILVAQSAIQVHGGMGFTWEMGLHYYLRSMLMRRELVQGLFLGAPIQELQPMTSRSGVL